MRNYAAKSVEEYISLAPAEAQKIMEELRGIILATVPAAVEGISWGVPFYKHHGLLGGFSVFKKHVSFGFNDQLDTGIRKKLEEKGYKTGAKTVQILFDQKVPEEEIRKIVKIKALSNEKEKGK